MTPKFLRNRKLRRINARSPEISLVRHVITIRRLLRQNMTYHIAMEDLLEIARTHIRRSVASDTVTACLPNGAVSGKAGAFGLEALVRVLDRPRTTSGEEVRLVRISAPVVAC